MVRLRRLLRPLVSSLVMLVLFTGNALGAEKIVLQLRWDHQFQFAGFYAAKWQGYYRAAGLDVDIRSSFSKDGKFLNAGEEVSQGRAHFGVTGTDLLLANEKSKGGLVALAPIFQESPLTLFSLPTNPMNSVQTLSKMKLGLVERGNIAETELRVMLEKAGLPPGTSFPDVLVTKRRFEALRDKKVGVVAGYAFEADNARRTIGGPVFILKPSNFGTNFYGDTLFTNQSLLQEDPKRVEAFVAASLKGWKYALTHAEEIAVRIAKEVPRRLSVKDPAAFNMEQIPTVVALTHFPVVPLGQQNLNRWKKIHSSLRSVGAVSGKFPGQGFVYEPTRNAEIRESVFRVLSLSIGLLFFAGSVIYAIWLGLRRRIEKARFQERDKVRDQLARFGRIVERSLNEVYVFDAKTLKCVLANRGARTNLGYSIEEMNELTPLDIEYNLSAHDLEELVRPLRERRKDFLSFQTKNKRKDGSLYDVEIHVQLMQEETPPVFVALAQDITEFKRTENALTLSENRFKDLFDKAPLGYQSLDGEGKFVAVNQAWLDMLGYQKEDVIGRPLQDFLVEDGFVENNLPQFVTNGEITVPTAQFKCKGGGVKYIHVDGRIGYDDKGEFQQTHCILTDVSERVALEERLRQSQKLEAIGQLTGGIAHDFNNILGIIQGNLELLKRKLGDNDWAIQRIEKALSGANRGGNLTKKLLGFSRQDPSAIIRTDINEHIKGLEDLVTKSVTAIIQVQINLEEGLWATELDPGDFEDACLNLILNARDAMPDGGVLILSTQNKQVGKTEIKSNPDAQEGDFVVVSVRDTGEGMSEDVLRKIFEPFFTTKEKGKGTGLGLSMVYGFAKRSGGWLNISSSKGQGTTIEMFLPRSYGEAIAIEPINQDQELPLGDEKVLVVDDEVDILEVAVSLLEELGYDVISAPNASEALALVKRGQKVNLLISDVVMPGDMDGFGLAKAIHEEAPEVKVLLTSGYAQKNEKSSAQNSAYFTELSDHMLRKPYSREQLASAVREALDRSN